MTEIVYKLENFDTPLENSRIFFLLGNASRLPRLFNDVVNSPKLASRVLISSSRSEVPLLFKAPWSAVFNPLDGKDWQLVLTYCLYMTRAAIIVIEDGVNVPEGFMARLHVQGSASAGLQTVICRQIGSAGAALGSADVVFLPAIEDLAGADADAAIDLLGGLLRDKGRPGLSEQKRAWLREVRSAKASLVWSRIGESAATGAVYWLDPADGAEDLRLAARGSVRKLLVALGELI